jgi:hypothetical protein
MDIVDALQREEAKLHRQLTAVQEAIAALNGGAKTLASPGHASNPNGLRKRTMSAALRARLSRKAKARWAKIKAEQGKKVK